MGSFRESWAEGDWGVADRGADAVIVRQQHRQTLVFDARAFWQLVCRANSSPSSRARSTVGLGRIAREREVRNRPHNGEGELRRAARRSRRRATRQATMIRRRRQCGASLPRHIPLLPLAECGKSDSGPEEAVVSRRQLASSRRDGATSNMAPRTQSAAMLRHSVTLHGNRRQCGHEHKLDLEALVAAGYGDR